LKFFYNNYKKSYSQVGEDVIIKFIFESLNIDDFSYIDIGANDPIRLNNTYKFYRSGKKGVLVEPNIDLCKRLKKVRRRDKVINGALGLSDNDSVEFYQLSPDTLSTISYETYVNYLETGSAEFVKKYPIKIITLESVVSILSTDEYFLSIDTEGSDIFITEQIKGNLRPTVICVETLYFRNDNIREIKKPILEYLENNGYLRFADTYINTIYVDENKWTSR
jgi:FkbM family methyltransferase